MAKIERFEELTSWQKARQLNHLVYDAARKAALAKDFGLRDQIRRASVSVMSNIAEGFERGGDREFIQFLSHAKGSCGEVRCQLYTAWDENYLTEPEFGQLYRRSIEVSRLISGFMRYLNRLKLQGSKFKRTTTEC
jgi:four helix bundle protein